MNANKILTSVTILLLTSTITSITYAQAESGDLLLTINNPTPEENDSFGEYLTDTTNGNILVSAPYDNTGASGTGSIYLFDGNDGNLLLTMNNPTPERNDYFGSSVVSTINDNILVSARRDDTGANDAGSVYLFNGTDGSLLLTINNPTPDENDSFGWSIASITNGNILVGTPNDNTGADRTGSAYLFNGTDGSLLLTINNPVPEYLDLFGWSITDTINGNILVGAYGDNTGADSAGSVYLFDGTDGSLLLTINNPTPEENDSFGYSIASTTNGNILIGARSDNTGADRAGSVYLFNGTNGNLLLTINNPVPEINNYFGQSVVSTINGHVLSSVPSQNLAYLFNGTDGSMLLTMNNPTPSYNDYFGYSVAGTSNGNMLISAPYDNVGAQYSGSVYLFRGILSEPAPIITSIIVNDPDDSDNIYSIDDTIVIQFDSDTNMPGGTDNQPRTAVNDLFTFTESIGQIYRGQWTTPDTFTITIKNVNNAAIVIGTTTVTPSGTTPILSTDGTSIPSSDESPILSGDFGELVSSPSDGWIVGEGIIYYDGGNVGIGTTSPSQKLDVNGNVVIKGTNFDAHNYPPAIDVNGAWIRLGDALGGDTFPNGLGIKFHDSGVEHASIKYTSASSTIDFGKSSSDGNSLGIDGTPTMTLDINNNNVGIGTTSPNSKLEVTNGYFELDTSSGVPPAEDCDGIDEIGRMKVDSSSTDLYICTSSGWVTK